MPGDFTKLDTQATPFGWSSASEQAAYDLAADELTTQAIADKAGVTRQALWLWRKHPDFAARVESHQADIRAEIRKRGIAVIENRVRALDVRWRKMHEVIEERASDPEMQGVAGGGTGLLVHNVKGVGKGENFQLIDLYEVDTGLLRELREHEKQAAQELGQWADKHEISGPNGGAVPHAFEVACENLYGDSDDPGGEVLGSGQVGGLPS